MNDLTTKLIKLITKLNNNWDLIDSIRPKIQEVVETMIDNGLKKELETAIWINHCLRYPKHKFDYPLYFDHAIEDFINVMKCNFYKHISIVSNR